MSLLVTGSIGIDTVKTPFGVSENCLGGSAIYFSLAASFFSPVRFVGVVGSDCPFDLAEVFAGRDVDLAGLEVRAQSKTFRWTGSYHENMDDRTTECMELNVLAEAPPKVPEVFKDSKFVFLANTAPALQLELLGQIKRPVFVDEARMLADEPNLIRAAQSILKMGTDVVVIKKGASGSIMSNADGELFVLPAYPADDVKDPTGAGDSFAGGFMGYLAAQGKTEFKTLRTAVAYGTVVASFTIADFSMNGLTCTSKAKIDARLEVLRSVTRF